MERNRCAPNYERVRPDLRSVCCVSERERPGSNPIRAVIRQSKSCTVLGALLVRRLIEIRKILNQRPGMVT